MRRLALLTFLLVVALATPAAAHKGNPNYESVVSRVDAAPGLEAEVIGGDDHLLLVYRGDRPLTVEGYEDEPYVRFGADGTVQVNQRSAAAYINAERDGNVPIPPQVDAKAAPEWKTVAQDGRYEFHDHRIHWMAKGDPAQVKDRSKRTKVFDWSVPVSEGASAGAIRGTLYWRGGSGGPPAGAFVAMGLFILGAVALVVVVRRRRAAEAW